jgi:hypothetical protein
MDTDIGSDLDDEAADGTERIFHDPNQSHSGVTIGVSTITPGADVIEGPDVTQSGTVTGTTDQRPHAGATPTSATTAIGKDAASAEGHLGNVAEFMSFGRILTDSEIQQMRRYLAVKWGL